MTYYIRITQEKTIDHGEYCNIKSTRFDLQVSLKDSDKLPEILSKYIKDIDSLSSVEIKIYRDCISGNREAKNEKE